MIANMKGETTTQTCANCGRQFLFEKWRLKQNEGKFCSKQCYHDAKGSWTTKRFWANVTRRDSGCWEWNGRPLQRAGYGRLRVQGKHVRAHRHAWQLTYGPVPDGLMVLHRCDNRICVNPAHLFLGNAHDNMRDMAEKGRADGFRRKGAAHPLAQLTQEQADEIRRRYIPKARYSNSRQLATEYGVSMQIIQAVVNGSRY